MSVLQNLRHYATERDGEHLPKIGAVVSIVWLVLVMVFAWLAPDDQAQDLGSWLIWLLGVVLPLVLVWFGIWSARTLTLLRREAEGLRAALTQMRNDVPGVPDAAPPATPRPPAPRRAPPPPPETKQADTRQARLEFDTPDGPDLTPTELFFALNFPDGPDDHEAIRCLRLALTNPGMARLIRAAQDVVTLLAGQGVYMDDLAVPETDARLWKQFAEGRRGADLAGLAVISDAGALDTTHDMIRQDEVFRDVAHHFMRQYDKLLANRVKVDDPAVLAGLAETRSGRAFVLLAQASGVLQGASDDA